MREKLKAALTEAMKAQDKRRTSTLRLVQAAIKDRDIAERTDGHDEGVSNDAILDILAKMIKQRRESAATYEQAGRVELAAQENEEIAIIQDFLPAQLDEAATQAACEAIVAELDAKGLKDMGRVMGELKKRYAGQMDFGKAGGLIKAKLSA